MNRSFSALAAYRPTGFSLTGSGEPQHLRGEMISSGLFEILGVNPVIGRTFTKEEDRRGVNPTAMISEELWRHKFGAAPDIIGKRLTLDGIGRTVIGVVPSNFRLRVGNFQDGTMNDVYTPVGEYNEPGFYADRAVGWGLRAIGRLKSGVTFEQARSDMDRVSRQLAALYPAVDNNERAKLFPLKEEMVGDMRPTLLVLLGAVAFVLLISCANVANLLLARSTSRQREFAIRIAMGAGRMRIIRQLLTESILLGLIGGVFGLMLASFGTAAAIAAVPRALPRAEEIRLDPRVLLFTFTISLIAGIMFGLTPALKTMRANVGGALKESGRSIAGRRSHAQSILVVLEVALALVLLVGAGLMIRTLFQLWDVNPGFNPRNLTTFSVASPSSLAKENPVAIRAFLRQIHNQLVSTPQVESASLNWASSPMSNDSDWYFWFTDRPRPAHLTDLAMALVYVVEPDYLKALQIPLVRGRFLQDSDNEHSAAVTVIDQKLAEKYYRGQDPIGHYLDLNSDLTSPDRRPPARIVGVVGHVNQWGLDSDISRPLQSQLYLPISQMAEENFRGMARGLEAYVRGRGVAPSFDVLRKRLLKLNGGLLAFEGQSMDEVLAESIAGKRFSMTLLTVFAGLALILASIGIYGVLSYLVGQRTQEIGVRVALGASRFAVLSTILADGARLTLIGIGIGVLAASGLTRLMSDLLFGVKPTDPLTFSLVALTLCAIALLACYVPGRRAMSIDPVVALREE